MTTIVKAYEGSVICWDVYIDGDWIDSCGTKREAMELLEKEWKKRKELK